MLHGCRPSLRTTSKRRAGVAVAIRFRFSFRPVVQARAEPHPRRSSCQCVHYSHSSRGMARIKVSALMEEKETRPAGLLSRLRDTVAAMQPMLSQLSTLDKGALVSYTTCSVERDPPGSDRISQVRSRSALSVISHLNRFRGLPPHSPAGHWVLQSWSRSLHVDCR